MRGAFGTNKELSETTVSKLPPGITTFPESSWLTVSQLMGIWNKQKFDVTRARTFPFLGSGPFLTKSELARSGIWNQEICSWEGQGKFQDLDDVMGS